MRRILSVVPTIALKFLLSKSSDRFLSFISGVSAVGVALGVLALTVVTSVINGFEGELAKVITGMNGDVIVYSRGEPIDLRVPGTSNFEEKLRQAVPELEAVTASFITELMVSGPAGVAGSILEGVDHATLSSVTSVADRLIAGRLPTTEGEVALGSVLAERIGAKQGTEVRLIAPFSGEGAEDGKGPQPKIAKARVVGVVSMGMYDYDSKYVFTPLPALQKFLQQPGKVTSFKLKLRVGTDSQAVSARLSEQFGYPFRARDWAQLNRNLFVAIQLEKAVIAIILTVIILVAAFNVVSTLMMMIHDKSRELAILKAMGLQPRQGFLIFCLIGVGIGLAGAVAGVGLGMGVNWLLARTRLIQLPADIYYIGFLPVVVRWQEIGMIAAGASLIAFLATLYPSLKVSRSSPLEGMRHD